MLSIRYVGPMFSIHSVRKVCVPLPILSLSGVDRYDCLSPSFSVLCKLWVELVLFQFTPHSVHPPQSGPSLRSLPSHLQCRHLLCNVRVFSSHHMAIPRKAVLGGICDDWLDHCIAPELFISDFVFPCFALNPSFAALLCVAPNTHYHNILYQSRSDHSFLQFVRHLHLHLLTADYPR